MDSYTVLRTYSNVLLKVWNETPSPEKYRVNTAEFSISPIVAEVLKKFEQHRYVLLSNDGHLHGIDSMNSSVPEFFKNKRYMKSNPRASIRDVIKVLYNLLSVQEVDQTISLNELITLLHFVIALQVENDDALSVLPAEFAKYIRKQLFHCPSFFDDEKLWKRKYRDPAVLAFYECGNHVESLSKQLREQESLLESQASSLISLRQALNSQQDSSKSLSNVVSSLNEDHHALHQHHNSLADGHNALEEKHTALLEKHTALEAALHEKHAALLASIEEKHATLHEKHAALEAALQEKHAVLLVSIEEKHVALQEKHAALQEKHAVSLASIEASILEKRKEIQEKIDAVDADLNAKHQAIQHAISSLHQSLQLEIREKIDSLPILVEHQEVHSIEQVVVQEKVSLSAPEESQEEQPVAVVEQPVVVVEQPIVVVEAEEEELAVIDEEKEEFAICEPEVVAQEVEQVAKPHLGKQVSIAIKGDQDDSEDDIELSRIGQHFVIKGTRVVINMNDGNATGYLDEQNNLLRVNSDEVKRACLLHRITFSA